MRFRKILSVLFCAMLGVSASAQSSLPPQIGKLLEKLPANRISADYECTLDINGTAVRLSGTVTAQKDCFRIQGKMVGVWCDGTSLLYTDPEAKEAYLEPREKLEGYVSANMHRIRDIRLSNVKTGAVSDDPSEFRLPLETFGEDWIITDLRK